MLVRKTLVIFALTAATPALAASPAAHPGWHPTPAVVRQIDGDIAQIDKRIDRAISYGIVKKRAGKKLKKDMVGLRQLYDRYRGDGLDRREVRDLEARINVLHARLRIERREWDGQTS